MFWSESMQLWVERTKDNKGKVHTITGKTKKVVKQKLDDFEKKQKRGRTFAECADAWEESHCRKVEETTSASYAPHVQRAKDFFADKYIIDITPDEVQSYVDYLAEDLNFKKDTVRRGLVVVNKIFKWAITQPGALIRYNPCSSVEIKRGLAQTRREPPEPWQLDIVRKSDPATPIGLFVHFLWYTGLRPGELLALRWTDIDRANKKISINKAAVYASNKAKVKDRTKTAAGIRSVPLIKPLEDILPPSGTGYVFGGAKPYDKSRFYRDWTKWCVSVGLAEKTEISHKAANDHIYTKVIYKPLITAYQFRHEYASMMEEEKISEFSTKNAMGHSSITITKDIYTHFREKRNTEENEILQKLNARFENEKSSEK